MTLRHIFRETALQACYKSIRGIHDARKIHMDQSRFGLNVELQLSAETVASTSWFALEGSTFIYAGGTGSAKFQK